MVRVSGDMGLDHSSGPDAHRGLSASTLFVRWCERRRVTSDGGGGQRKLRGCGEAAMSTAQHGEHAVGWVADGEGEW